MMKKMNNRGFVISTVLYTLVIMVFLIVILLMSFMAASRRNTRNLTDTIEDELNRYSETKTDIAFKSDGSIQTYIVPYGQAGWYKIELWGGAGGSIYNSDGSISSKGGAGAYTSGIFYLEENTYVHFVVGGAGSEGGVGGEPYGGSGSGAAGGGSATTVSINNAENIIMVAAGGGGASKNAPGGAGGGLTGDSGNIKSGSSLARPTGGTQTQVGRNTNNTLPSDLDWKKGGYAQGKGAGGGGGYRGGGAGCSGSDNDIASGAGGSSYIMGYAPTNASASPLAVINPIMIAGANDSTGFASIELISKDNPTPKTNILENVRYIRDCNDNKKWAEIQVITKNGQNIAYSKLTTAPLNQITDGSIDTTATGSSNCVTIDLGSVHNDIAEIAIYHDPNNSSYEGRKAKNNSVSVSNNNSTWRTLKTAVANEVPEDATGIRFSIWQSSTEYNAKTTTDGLIEDLPSGNYYIISALGKNQALETTDKTFNGTVNLNNFTGKDTQKWTIESIERVIKATETEPEKTEKYYRIVGSESQYAMQVVDSLSQAGSRINTSSSYGADYGWTKWKIKTAKDQTFYIYPFDQKTPGVVSTYLSTATNSWNTNSFMQLANKDESAYSQRFYLINTD